MVPDDFAGALVGSPRAVAADLTGGYTPFGSENTGREHSSSGRGSMNPWDQMLNALTESWTQFQPVLEHLGRFLFGILLMLAPTLILMMAIYLTIRVILRRLIANLWVVSWVGGHEDINSANLSRAQWIYVALNRPSEVFHEYSHAIGDIISGYRTKVHFSWDKDGDRQAYCQALDAWAFWANPMMDSLLSSMAPMILGSLMFYGLLRWIGVQSPDMGVVSVDSGVLSVQTHLLAIGHGLVGLVSQLPWSDWRLYLIVVLGFFLADAMQPSRRDSIIFFVALISIFIVFTVLYLLSQLASSLVDPLNWCVLAFSKVLALVDLLLVAGLAVSILASVFMVPVVWGHRRFKRWSIRRRLAREFREEGYSASGRR